MSFFENTRKPVGLGGKIMVAMMNIGHSAMAAWGLHFLQTAPEAIVLDCGCGTGPMIAILSEKYPKKHYTGLDLTPEMIEKAKQKNLTNAEFVVGDCENLPFADNSFDVVICTNSFHHYPNPQAFFDSVYRVLRKGGRLILRDYTSFGWVIWLMNHVEMPLANLCGHGDVKVYKKEEYKDMIKKAGFSSMMIQAEKKMRCHVVATK